MTCIYEDECISSYAKKITLIKEISLLGHQAYVQYIIKRAYHLKQTKNHNSNK